MALVNIVAYIHKPRSSTLPIYAHMCQVVKHQESRPLHLLQPWKPLASEVLLALASKIPILPTDFLWEARQGGIVWGENGEPWGNTWGILDKNGKWGITRNNGDLWGTIGE